MAAHVTSRLPAARRLASNLAQAMVGHRGEPNGFRPVLYVGFTATWRSGYAAACKAVYTGSIPVVASNEKYLQNGTFRALAAPQNAEKGQLSPNSPQLGPLPDSYIACRLSPQPQRRSRPSRASLGVSPSYTSKDACPMRSSGGQAQDARLGCLRKST
jgi:hypothetical protein